MKPEELTKNDVDLSTLKIEKNLTRLHKTALEQEDDLEFFKSTNAYTEYVLETPILKTVIDEQMAERAGRYEKLEQAEAQAVKEMLVSKDKLLEIIKNKNINPKDFSRLTTFSTAPDEDLVAEMEAYERGEIHKGRFRSDSYEQFLFDIASNLQKMGYQNELGEMAVTQEQYRDYYARINGTSGYWFAGNVNGSFIFSKTWPERFEQETLLERERTLKKWGSVEKIIQLKCAFDAVLNNVSFWKITENESPYAHLFKVEDTIDIGYMAEDLSHLMGQTRSDSPRKFRQDRLHASALDRLNVVAFKSILQTIHNTLMQKVEQVGEEKVSTAQVKRDPIKSSAEVSKKTKENLERKMQLVRDSRNTKSHFQAIMDYHEWLGENEELSPLLSELISEDRIAPVYIKEIFNDFILSQYLKAELPVGFKYPIFYSKKLEQKYHLMEELCEKMKTEYDPSHFPQAKLYFDPNWPIIKSKRDDDFFYIQKLYNDLLEIIENSKDTSSKRDVEPAKKIIHEHHHRFENSIQEKDLNLNITNEDEKVVRKNSGKKVTLPKFPRSEWAKVSINFLDETNILLSDSKSTKPSSFEGLGCDDGRNGKADENWNFLLKLARGGGQTLPLTKKERESEKKKKQKITDILRKIFQNDTDPFEAETGGVYKAKFNIKYNTDNTQPDLNNKYADLNEVFSEMTASPEESGNE